MFLGCMVGDWFAEAFLTSFPNKLFSDLQMDFRSFLSRGRIISAEKVGFVVCTTNHRLDEFLREFKPYKIVNYVG